MSRRSRWRQQKFRSYRRSLSDLQRAAQDIAPDLAHLIPTSIAQPDKTYLVDFWLRGRQPRLFTDRLHAKGSEIS